MTKGNQPIDDGNLILSEDILVQRIFLIIMKFNGD